MDWTFVQRYITMDSRQKQGGVEKMSMTQMREKRGWSKSELARRTGIGLTEICRIESGKIYPYPGWRKKIAAALETSERTLFPGVVKRNGLE
jgi:transcriptional regulator with XRE-family HTH domain